MLKVSLAARAIAVEENPQRYGPYKLRKLGFSSQVKQRVIFSRQMAEGEYFPVDLESKPSCGLTKQWDRINADGTRTVRYAGADGYLYDKVHNEDTTIWLRVGKK